MIASVLTVLINFDIVRQICLWHTLRSMDIYGHKLPTKIHYI